MRTVTQQFIRDCSKLNLKPGDQVKVLRTATRGERGWGVGWGPKIDSLIGEIITITRYPTSAGFGTRTETGRTWNLPWFVLEKVE